MNKPVPVIKWDDFKESMMTLINNWRANAATLQNDVDCDLVDIPEFAHLANREGASRMMQGAAVGIELVADNLHKYIIEVEKNIDENT